MKTEPKKYQLKHIDYKVAEKIHKQLVKKLEKADDRKVFNYDLDAHSEFCADVVVMMDVMIGQVAARVRKERRNKTLK